MIDNIPPPYAGGQVATGGQLGLLGNRDVMDTPFNQTSYTAKKVQDQQAKTVRDALIDDPSVRSFYSDGTTGIDAMYIRGFSVLDLAGLRRTVQGIAPYLSVMPEMAERIEVLKGPSAMLFGMPPGGGIGGMVNIVPKRAGNDPLTQFTATYNSSSQFGGHVDLARRLGSDKQFGVRVNGVYRAGPTEMQWNTDLRALALLGLDFRGERVRLSADFGYQYQFINGLIPFVALGANVQLPWAPNARSNPGGQPWSTNERKDTFGVVRGEVDLTERITAYASFGAHDYRQRPVRRLQRRGQQYERHGHHDAAHPEHLHELAHRRGRDPRYRRHRADRARILGEWPDPAAGSERQRGQRYRLCDEHLQPIDRRPAQPCQSRRQQDRDEHASSIAIADTLTAADKRVQLTVGGRLQQVKSAKLQRAHRCPDIDLRPERADARRGAAGQAVEQRLFLRQLHPGPAAGHRRRGGLHERGRDLPALQVDAVRDRREGRLGQVHHHGKPLPDHAAQHPDERDEQHSVSWAANSATGDSSSMSSANLWRACA